MEALVKNRFGFTQVRECSVRDQELTTKPIMGNEWAVENSGDVQQSASPENYRHVPAPIAKPCRCTAPSPQAHQFGAGGRGSKRPASSNNGPLQLPLFAEPGDLPGPSLRQTAA